MNIVKPLAASIGLLCAGAVQAAPLASDIPAMATAQVRKVVQVGDDVIVVSLVAADGQTRADNVGITRYGADGTPVAWRSAGAWNPGGGAAIVFPNSAWHFTAIRDVQVFKDHLWVLADSAVVDGDGASRRSTDILTFSTAGEFKGGHFNVIHPGPSQDVIGAGMAFKAAADGEGADRLLVVAGCPEDGQSGDRLCLQRFLLSTREDWYPSFAGDGSTQTRWTLTDRGVASTAPR
ncbi:MAG TPA: hypothetical protein VMR06_09710 [Dokdonella sp.]|uniref:hypothetical protein n=1 Tax=Dokdonella sp. TaxID=2291710 RepID=UPI002D132EA7|nr:hypothetical protein [Dokdonella sp.]HUD42254.1 hypothetical protein [Dokdonella sp.]